MAKINKPEFIANVDTANEEIARLVEAHNTLDDTHEATARELTEVKDQLKTAQDAEKNAKEELTKAVEAKQVAEKAAAQAKTDALTTVANAGVTEPAKVQGTNAIEDENKGPKVELKGLARAMAANIKLQEGKTPRTRV